MKTQFVKYSVIQGLLIMMILSVPLLSGCIPAKTEPPDPTRALADRPTVTAEAARSARVPAVVPTVTQKAAGPIQAPGLSLTLLDAGKTIYMQKGEMLTVTLEGNPSTGYSWELVSPENSILSQVGETEFQAKGNLPGAPASMVLVFKAAKDGQHVLKLVYHRSWEKDLPPANSFEVTVAVGHKAENAAPTQTSGTLAETAVTPTTIVYPPNGIQGWLTYINRVYGFSFQYPPAWELEEGTGTMLGHAVRLLPTSNRNVMLQVAFKGINEDVRIGRTGLGSGDLVLMGKVLLVGQEIDRQVLVFQGKHMTVHYDCSGCMQRGKLEFGFDLDYRGNWVDTAALPADVETQADLVVASLRLSQ